MNLCECVCVCVCVVMCIVRVYTHKYAQIHTLYRVCVFVLGEHTVCHNSQHTKKCVRGTVGLALVTLYLRVSALIIAENQRPHK